MHPVQRNNKVIIHCQAPIIEKRNVKSSSGCEENRPMIKTNINYNNNRQGQTGDELDGIEFDIPTIITDGTVFIKG